MLSGILELPGMVSKHGQQKTLRGTKEAINLLTLTIATLWYFSLDEDPRSCINGRCSQDFRYSFRTNGGEGRTESEQLVSMPFQARHEIGCCKCGTIPHGFEVLDCLLETSLILQGAAIGSESRNFSHFCLPDKMGTRIAQ